MPSRFPIHTRESAPAAARPALDVAERTFGFLPNLMGVLGEAPAAAAGYLGLAFQFEATSFSAAERQVVQLAASVELGSDYCVGVHRVLAASQGLSARTIDSIVAGAPLEDGRTDALARFARRLVATHGCVEEGDLARFLAAGFTRAQALEAVLGVALKTLSHGANALADTPLDAPFVRRGVAKVAAN